MIQVIFTAGETSKILKAIETEDINEVRHYVNELGHGEPISVRSFEDIDSALNFIVEHAQQQGRSQLLQEQASSAINKLEPIAARNEYEGGH